MSSLRIEFLAKRNYTALVGTKKNKFLALIGPCASVLCLLHCWGFALLTILSPSFILAFKQKYNWVEYPIWAAMLIFGLMSLIRLRAHDIPKVLFTAFVLLAVGGTLTLFVPSVHYLFHLSVSLMAVVQVIALYYHSKLKEHPPECCQEMDHTH